jgi:hypothetical protein
MAARTFHYSAPGDEGDQTRCSSPGRPLHNRPQVANLPYIGGFWPFIGYFSAPS